MVVQSEQAQLVLARLISHRPSCYLSGSVPASVLFFAHFLCLLTWRKYGFSNRNRSDEAFLVGNVPVGCIRFLSALDRVPLAVDV